MKTIIAESWAHLHEQLFDGSWNKDLMRYRSPYAFRGQPSDKFNLKTSLMRLGGNYRDLEKHLLRNFRKYGHDSFDTTDVIWHWLTKPLQSIFLTRPLGECCAHTKTDETTSARISKPAAGAKAGTEPVADARSQQAIRAVSKHCER